MPAAVAIVGNSNSGKTRVASTLIKKLTGVGYRVAAVKHCPHGHELDRLTSDTSRLYQSGAVTVVASSPGKLTVVNRIDGDTPLDSIIASVGMNTDLVIAEGFKDSALPKVMVLSGKGAEPSVENVIATVGAGSPLNTDVPHFRFAELDRLAALVVGQLIQTPPPELSVWLAIDGVEVSLSCYPARALAGMVQGFLSSLRGVPEAPREIRITVQTRHSRP